MMIRVFNCIITATFCIVGFTQLWSQELSTTFNIELKGPLESTTNRIVNFNDHLPNDVYPLMPHWHKRYSFPLCQILHIQLSPHSITTSPLTFEEKAFSNTDFEVQATLIKDDQSYHIEFLVVPFRVNAQGLCEQATSFDIVVRYAPIASALINPFKERSVLADGDIYKLAVEKEGVYRIDKNFIQNILKLNPTNIDPQQVKILGNRGGRVPERNSVSREDDLAILPLWVIGGGDGRYDDGDAVIFYTEGADRWYFVDDILQYEKNIYDTKQYVFLKIDNQPSPAIQSKSYSGMNPDIIVDTYDDWQRFEDEQVNLLGSFPGTEGTGKDWFGDYFRATRERTYTNKFDFKGIDTSKPVSVSMRFAARSSGLSTVQLSVGDNKFSRNFSSVSLSNTESTFARVSIINESVAVDNILPTIAVSYPSNGTDNEGWLDYITLKVPKKLDFSGQNLLYITHQELSTYATARMMIANGSGYNIWDITDPLVYKSIPWNDQYVDLDIQKKPFRLIAFRSVMDAMVPSYVGPISNQNLHGIQEGEVVVIYHKDFAKEVDRWAEHRASHSNKKIIKAEVEQIYNEFSAGRIDVAGIRDFIRMLYLRIPDFKYVLLFGDGSYDYKGLVRDLPYENFVPVYETDESLDPINGFPSDDFYGLLDEQEGFNLQGGLDVYVGRLPVKSIEEAKDVVDKIIHYDVSPYVLGDWRLQSMYVADDEDGNTHVRDMDEIARNNTVRQELHNQQKVYIDAYRQVSTSGDARYPEANSAINNGMFKGLVAVTYLGHGGPLGWAQERIITVPEILAWNNKDNLTVFTTATCSFAAYDDPATISPAEHALLNSEGGAISLFSTTRAVYTSSNKTLTDAVHDLMFNKTEGKAPTFGYILSEGKNKYQNDFFRVNSRKFTLLGDPSQQIALPQHKVVVTSVNDIPVNAQVDTVGALDKVTISGIIADEWGNKRSTFNGTLFPTVYDKSSELYTLANDKGSARFGFDIYRNILFKGAASVIDGEWSFTFWMPKDINYSFGEGRISLYASDAVREDAAGVFTDFIIGGTGTNIVEDENGPRIQLFMNDESFVDGGITNANPVLLVKLSDDLGINVTGNAIGHDITAILDEDQRNIFILNDFFVAEKDDFRSGSVKFPLNNLDTGWHKIDVKAWDVSNNSTEATISFMVIDEGSNLLENVMNYPNPFENQTFFSFEHGLSDTELEIGIDIYSIDGKLIKKISQTKYSTGFRVNNMSWAADDDFGAKLTKGIYIYKVFVFAPDENIRKESAFEKLIVR